MSIKSNLIRWTVLTVKSSNLILHMTIEMYEQKFDVNLNIIELYLHSSNSKIDPTAIIPPPIPGLFPSLGPLAPLRKWQNTLSSSRSRI